MVKTAHLWVVMLENNLIFQVLRKEFSSLLIFLSPYLDLLNLKFEFAKPWLFLALIISALLWLVYWAAKLYSTWLESNRSATIFEVLPPTSTEQSSYTTTQLFSSVYGLLRQRNWIHRLLDVSKSYSFEIVSSKDQGIRYI